MTGDTYSFRVNDQGRQCTHSSKVAITGGRCRQHSQTWCIGRAWGARHRVEGHARGRKLRLPLVDAWIRIGGTCRNLGCERRDRHDRGSNSDPPAPSCESTTQRPRLTPRHHVLHQNHTLITSAHVMTRRTGVNLIALCDAPPVPFAIQCKGRWDA
jgi:hypothetical protein